VMSLHEKGFWTRQEARGLDQSRRDIEPHPFSWDDPPGFIDARTGN
jgi:hypothetical protein